MEISTYLKCALLQAVAEYITIVSVFGSMQTPKLRDDFEWDLMKQGKFGWLTGEPFMDFDRLWTMCTEISIKLIFSAPYWGGGLLCLF